METYEIIREELTKKGWIEEPKIYKSTDIRMSYKLNGNHLELDNRPKEKYIWLWLFSKNDRSCFGIPYIDIMKVLEKITSMQDSLRFENYLSNYMALQADFDVKIMMWEQFEAKERMQSTNTVSGASPRQPQSGNFSGDDPVIFPGKKIEKLSDYVAIIKAMQNGDLNSVFQKYGIDLASWSTIAMEWTTKMTSVPDLNQKFVKMISDQ